MNDRELQNLVRMAAEIETLEREALVGPDLRLVGVGADESRFQIGRWLAGAGVAAAAAGLALGAFVALQGGAQPGTTGPIAHAPAVPAPATGEFSRPLVAAPVAPARTGFEQPLVRTAAADASKKVVVFSLFKDGDGKCACYQWHETEGKPLEEMARGELVDIALRAPCTGEAQRVVVIAVGSKNLQGDPAALANQVAELPLHRDPAMAALAYPALFPNSTVITETVSMERVKLPTAADLIRPQ
jgi:hypothetical protein